MAEREHISTPEIVASWGEYLDQFREEIYPTFATRGIQFVEALVIWKINETYNKIHKLVDLKLDEIDPDLHAPWRAKKD